MLDGVAVGEVARQNEIAELVNLLELVGHLVFELLNLLAGHGVFGKIKNFLGKHFEDFHAVFADILVGSAGGAQVREEIFPAGIPFEFENFNDDVIAHLQNTILALLEVFVAS